MCGIYGSTKLYSEDLVLEKLNKIKFRGPDNIGFVILDEKIVFGHNRLAIVDLDSRSNQPFNYLNLTIVFNGEIYNFLELKIELIAKGFEFKTTADTEIICASYLYWGMECVSKFNGMFAFVIYDRSNNILFGSRDRLGVKPFYYLNNEKWFEFSSQPSPLVIGNKLTLDERSISQFLCWHHVPEPNSIFNEVKKLPAGNSFVYNLSTKNLKIFKYWDIIDFESEKISYYEAKSTLKNLIIDATKMRLIADVPVGVFLSGGIDSSLIASVAQSISSKPISTFAIKFSDAKFDESIYAYNIANFLNTNHTTITCNFNDALDLIENFSNYFDEPFGDGSAIPTMLLAKHTKKNVTVALSGDGGDEGFLGYERYDWMLKFQRIMAMPKSSRNTLSYLLKLSSKKRLQSIGHVINLDSLTDIYKSINSTTNTDFLINKELALTQSYDEIFDMHNIELLEKISNYDIKTYLNNDINTKVDRATMAFSLEARAPLMDYRVIEYSRKLPVEFKYFEGNKKRILKDILSDYLPNYLFDRPKKGFGAPLNDWFRKDLKSFVNDTLIEKNLESIPNLDVKKVLKLIDLHMRNKLDSNVLIWDLLVFLQWKNSFNF